MYNKYCISSEDVIKEAVSSSKKKREDFNVDPYIILFFSGFLLEYLKKEANVEQIEWLAPYHPYAAAKLFKGAYQGIPITAISPPMGASPISSITEDLITCGANVILLVCGAWGIGRNIKLLEYLIPTHAIGFDGTSIHYGRELDEELEIEPSIVKILVEETKKRTKKYHIGKNFSKEAFYTITREEIGKLQNKGVISMENGELNVLATICKLKGLKFGAIFYSYCNLLEGWRVPWGNEKYRECVYLETEIALSTIKKMDNMKIN
ncbi:MAG: hypothetical protein ACFE8L_09595 [Candidatus Hodarchaeota archaeon]